MEAEIRFFVLLLTIGVSTACGGATTASSDVGTEAGDTGSELPTEASASDAALAADTRLPASSTDAATRDSGGEATDAEDTGGVVTATWDTAYCSEGAAFVYIAFDGAAFEPIVCTDGSAAYALSASYAYHDVQAYLTDSSGNAMSNTFSQRAITNGEWVTLVFDSPLGAADHGVLEISWTINGICDAASCTVNNASYAEVAIAINGQAADYTAACATCSMRISLPVGFYDAATITLDQSNGTAVTTAGTVSSLTMTGGASIPVSFDFPLSSFL
jgi:hypothetical protein